MNMKTQMDKLVGYEKGGSIGGINPSQMQNQVTPLPQVISTGPPLSPDAEKEERPPTEEGSMTIQPTFPTEGSPEYERYLQAIQNLPEGGLENLPSISAEPEQYTTELSPGGPDTSFVGGRNPALVAAGLIKPGTDINSIVEFTGTSLDAVSDALADLSRFGDTSLGKVLNALVRNTTFARALDLLGITENDVTVEEAAKLVKAAQDNAAHFTTAQDFHSTVAPMGPVPGHGQGVSTVSANVLGQSGAGGRGPYSGARASGGLVQTMYDGGVVRMADGGTAKDVAYTAASFTPVIGDVIDIKEFIEAATRKGGPDYKAMGIAALGLVPYVGDVAQAGIKASKKTDMKEWIDKLKELEWKRRDVKQPSRATVTKPKTMYDGGLV